MSTDRYSAVWVSHSSLSDYVKCPRAYFLKNVYKDPKTGHKIQVVTPSLSLGSIVHDVIESLSILPLETRFSESLLDKYERSWQKVSGKMGGFLDEATEHLYKERGAVMLRKLINNPGPLKNKAIKIKTDLPQYWLSEELGIMLCGKIDWIEYLPDTDSVHIIDFKTSKHEEDGNSLQLPIYYLLVQNTQNRTVSKASYWYLELHDDLTPKELPNLQDAGEQVLTIAKRVKLARQLQKFDCPTGGCSACKPFESILSGKGEFVGVSDQQHRDLYILNSSEEFDVEIL